MTTHLWPSSSWSTAAKRPLPLRPSRLPSDRPPQDLDDALSFLTILYGHVPSVTTYPVYLGDLDALLEPFVPADMSNDELDRKLRRFWVQLDHCSPTPSSTPTSARRTVELSARSSASRRSLRQVVPNITLKVDPQVTPDSLIEDGVETVFATGKPHSSTTR